MKLHFRTNDKAPYFFEYSLDIIDDEEFYSLLKEKDLDEVLNSDDVLDSISDSDLSDIIEVIDNLFDKTTNGMFDWNDKTGDYYNLFDSMLHELVCSLENEAGDIIKKYECELSDGYFDFSGNIMSISLCNFYSGNGEPIGAQLALDMVEVFMKAGNWHIGFYDSNAKLVTNISNWAKEHVLVISNIKPIVWFGNKENVCECWSITPDTRDLFVKEYWGNYYEGALPYICKADEGLGIYYSVWEYGLDYDPSIFENIKSDCPIDLNLPNEDRTNALYNLMISIYNENKADDFPLVEHNLYSKNVIACDIVVKSVVFNYTYSKQYKFDSNKLSLLDKDIIEDILWEDEDYRRSFCYLEDHVISRCDLGSCKEVWKTVKDVVSEVQSDLNNNLLCQIINDGHILREVPFTVDLDRSKLHFNKMNNDVFIKSLIEFFKRGRWYIDYKDASELPKTYNEYAKVIEQKGQYPIIWFNDSEEIIAKMAIWPAQSQYMLSLTWKNAADFCSHVFNNIEVNNEYKNNGLSLYKDLEAEFERIKSECPILIKNENEPVDFVELSRVVAEHQNSLSC